jgi:hypothetical protein
LVLNYPTNGTDSYTTATTNNNNTVTNNNTANNTANNNNNNNNSSTTNTTNALDYNIYFSRLLHFYSELLYQWELPLHAAQVRKHFRLLDSVYFNNSSLEEYIVSVKSVCQRCGKIINDSNDINNINNHDNINNSDSKNNNSSSKNNNNNNIYYNTPHDTPSSLWCSSCHTHGINCTLCEEPVRGASIFCSVCGHGGHVTCLSTFFSIESECPSGCGCCCAKMGILETDDVDKILFV